MALKKRERILWFLERDMERMVSYEVSYKSALNESCVIEIRVIVANVFKGWYVML